LNILINNAYSKLTLKPEKDLQYR